MLSFYLFIYFFFPGRNDHNCRKRFVINRFIERIIIIRIRKKKINRTISKIQRQLIITIFNIYVIIILSRGDILNRTTYDE